MNREDFSPPYWTNMGAVAINALAGSILILRGETWPLLSPLLPFIRGFTFFFWAVASWWIPFLFALMISRYLWLRDRFTYEPAIWGMVFPRGMYMTSTYQYDRGKGYGFLDLVPEVLVYVALAACAWCMAGLGRPIERAGRAARREPPLVP